MKTNTKEYANGQVTIVWKPDLCIHSKICWNSVNGLPEVFQPRERPWVNPAGASTEQIISQVVKCPSGALSYYLNNDTNKVEELRSTGGTVVEVLENGPLMVYGDVTVKDTNGCETIKNKATAFCRCGASSNKPYCDGAHSRIQFIDKRPDSRM